MPGHNDPAFFVKCPFRETVYAEDEAEFSDEFLPGSEMDCSVSSLLWKTSFHHATYAFRLCSEPNHAYWSWYPVLTRESLRNYNVSDQA